LYLLTEMWTQFIAHDSVTERYISKRSQRIRSTELTEYELLTREQTIPNNHDRRITEDCRVTAEVCIPIIAEFLVADFVTVYSHM